MATRPTLKQLFVKPDRRLEIYFYTSNLPKYLHARTVFEAFGILLSHFKSRQDPYEEFYGGGTKTLLRKAIDEIRRSVSAGTLFFVEDTSVRIEALSKEGDVPGMSVKEWFASTTFEAVDRQLRSAGGDRRATVKSDIGLHLPGLTGPIFFHGETSGVVAESPPAFDENPHHPWLTPKTFNGWFVPNGSTLRLGEMSYDESVEYDFRTQALIQLVDRLEEYAAILNLPRVAYSTKPEGALLNQPELFAATPKVLVVVGETCAGKTTFGEHASWKSGIRFVDASNVVRALANERGLVGTPLDVARELMMLDGNDVVARNVVEIFESDIASKGLIVTGFRTIDELDCVGSMIGNVQTVLIESSERTRYERFIRRRRSCDTVSLTEFRKIDESQRSFGLLRVAEDFANCKIVNEGSFEEYWQQIDAVQASPSKAISGVRGVSWTVRPRQQAERNQLYRCLKVLSNANQSLTSKQIELVTSLSGSTIAQENVNKALKNVPELVQRVEGRVAESVRYQILPAGRAYVRLTEQTRASAAVNS